MNVVVCDEDIQDLDVDAKVGWSRVFLVQTKERQSMLIHNNARPKLPPVLCNAISNEKTDQSTNIARRAMSLNERSIDQPWM